MLEWIKRLLWQDRDETRSRPLTSQLIASLVDLEEAKQLSDTPEQLAELTIKGGTPVDQVGQAIAARLVLGERMELPELTRYVQHLQNRYAVAVGSASFARYLQGVPKTVFEDLTLLKAELKTLSYRLRLAYSITHIRDRQLSIIRTFCFIFLLLSLGFVVASLFAQDVWGLSSPILNFLIIGAVGFGGALTSIARRANQILSSSPLDEDPVIQASALQQGSASLLIAALSGPIFALVLMLIFMSGLVKFGEIQPKFDGAACLSGCGRFDFRVFQYTFSFSSAGDAAKMGVWAFVAGFAEQFVPDMLDGFANIGKKK